MKEAVAGLVTLEAVRLHVQDDGTLKMTEEELHELIVEALSLGEFTGTEAPRTPVYDGAEGVAAGLELGPRRGLRNAGSDSGRTGPVHHDQD